MRKWGIIFFIIAISLSGFSQVGATLATTSTTPYSGDHLLSQLMAAGDASKYTIVDGYKVSGYPFYKEKKFKGSIETQKSATHSNLDVLFNLYDQKLYLLNANGIVTGAVSDALKSFSLSDAPTNTLDLFIANDSIGLSKKGYSKILFEKDSISVFQYNYMILGQSDGTLVKEFKVYEKITEYYFRNGKGKLEKFKLNKKNIAKVLGKANEQLITKANDETLDFSSESDFLKILSWIK